MSGFNRAIRLYRKLHPIYAMEAADRSVPQRMILAIGAPRFQRLLNDRFGAMIGLGAEIGADLILPHMFHGIFIAEKAKIGSGCTILHHVTVGATNKGSGNWIEAPQIGNDVFIGANATIIGRCIIGDGAKIGAGVTLVDAVIPPGAVIINKSAFNLTEGKPVYQDKEPQPAARLVS